MNFTNEDNAFKMKKRSDVTTDGHSGRSQSLLTVQRLGVGQVFLKLLVQVFTDADVLEHPLQLGRVFEPTCLLQGKNKTRSSVSV